MSGIHNVTIKNTNIMNFSFGIYGENDCSYATVSRNNITNNYCGMAFVGDCHSISISKNNITNNDCGVSISTRCSGVNITENNMTNNNYGIYSVGWNTLVTISDNNIASNNRGIHIGSSYGSYSTISRNNITANADVGIRFWSSGSCTVVENNITDNGRALFLVDSGDNTFYHNNFIDNTIQVDYIGILRNYWDNGYPSGGNYWSDYGGTDKMMGPSQDHAGSDGIGDTPYVIDANNRDNYPLMKPYPWASHDIGITSLTTSKTIVVQGYNVSISIMAFNYGSYTENFNVTVYANETEIGEVNSINLGSRNFIMITFTWNTSGFAIGNYTISAVADMVTNETDILDNTCIDGIVNVRLPIHDIAVTDVTLSKTVVGQGYSLNINVTAANQGDYTETFNVTVYANTTIIETKTNITLTSGDSTNITFTWNTTGFAKGNYTIWAYAWPVPGETDTADNTLTDGWVIVAMVGDITGGTPNLWDDVPDGKVDGKDLSKVAKCFGSWPGAPPPMIWNPNCDINNDGKIDGRDRAMGAKHYGESDP